MCDTMDLKSLKQIIYASSNGYTISSWTNSTINSSSATTLSQLCAHCGLSSERRVLPNCRVYFGNHKSKTTQWEDPHCYMAEQLPLRCGWEMRFTEDNKRYFIDHNTKTTTFKGNYCYMH